MAADRLEGLAHDLRRGDAQQVTPLTRHGTLHDDAVVLDLHHLELAGGHRLVTHLRVHPLTGVDAAGGGTGADGTVLTVALGTVRHETAREAVLLHRTLPALTDGRTSHVHQVTRVEDLRRVELLAEFVRGGLRQAELLEVAHGRDTSLGAVANLGLGDLVVSHLVVGNLNRVVAVGVDGLHLKGRREETNDGEFKFR